MPTQTRQQKTAESIDDLKKRIDYWDETLPRLLKKISDKLQGTVAQLGRITNKVLVLEDDLHQMPVAPTSNMNIVRANVLTTRVTPDRIRSRARKARKTKKRKQLKRKGSRKRRR